MCVDRLAESLLLNSSIEQSLRVLIHVFSGKTEKEKVTTRVIVAPTGHLVMSGDRVESQEWEGTTAIYGQRPGMMLNYPPVHKTSPHNKELSGTSINSTEVEKPCPCQS